MRSALKFFFIFLFISPARGQVEEEWLAFEPAEVTLSGTILIENLPGPPGYGETPEIDSLEKIAFLILDEPVNIKGDPESEINNQNQNGVSRVQLVFRFEFSTLDKFIGKEISIRGTLFTAHSAHHKTEVLFNVKQFLRPKQKIKPFNSIIYKKFP